MATGTMPSAWLDEDPRTIQTAMEILLARAGHETEDAEDG